MLQRRIALDLEESTLIDAIDAVSRAAHIAIVYSDLDLPGERRVTLQATKITVAGALTTVLLNSGVDVGVSPEGTLMLTRALREGASTQRVQQSATVRGLITDATTHAALSGATVRITENGRATVAGSDGRYVINGLRPGTYTVVARRLGYRQGSTSIRLGDGQTDTVDFRLTPSAAELDQVVTTATGDQRAVELGHVVATLSVADSIVGKLPVTDLSDVLSGRVSNVQLFSPGGFSGASAVANMRGQNSSSLSNEPLLYVDGVRVDNSTVGMSPISGSTTGGRFDDIMPEEIESIEIVKGPAASALYGTDAANGIILVTTKRGKAGPARWTAFGEHGVLTADRDRYPLNYYPWGTSTDGTNTIEQCPLVMAAAVQCHQDSVTQFNPLRDPEYSPIGTGERDNDGLQVAGGSTQTRYFLSGSYENETGYLTLPPYDRGVYNTILAGRISPEYQNPNAYEKYGGRANIASSFGEKADISASLSFLSQDSRIPTSTVLGSAARGPGYNFSDTSQNCHGWLFCFTPGTSFIQKNDENIAHFTPSVSGNWRPIGWLSGRGTIGVDYSQNYQDVLQPADVVALNPAGFRVNEKNTIANYTLNASITASFNVTSDITTRTSVGGQYYRNSTLITAVSAVGLQPGATTSAGASSIQGSEQSPTSVVLGGFVEEQFGLWNRLFFTGGVRADGSSSFGQGIQTPLYPKASASWLLSDEPWWPRSKWVNTIRLRAAYGESGVQPPSTAAIAQESYLTGLVDGQPAVGLNLFALGNQDLKPERQREAEGGVDFDIFDSRLHLEATYYDKRSADALVQEQLGLSLGAVSGAQYVNIGSVRNWGYEAQLTARVFESKLVSWDVSANGSVNHNQLLSYAPGVNSIPGGFGAPGLLVGYPLFAFFDYPYTYHDANHNGIIEPNEITLGSKQAFKGPSYPGMQWSGSTTLSLFKDILTIRAQLDHRGDFLISNQALRFSCLANYCAGTSTPHASLADQAAAVALDYGVNGNTTSWGYFQNGAFTRLRELSATVSLPTLVSHAVRARSLSLTLSARNLALWTSYRGADPEVASGLQGIGLAYQGAYIDSGAPILPTYWIARVNVGL